MSTGVQMLLCVDRRLAVTKEMTAWFTANLEGFYGQDRIGLDKVLYQNAVKLMPRLANMPRSPAFLDEEQE